MNRAISGSGIEAEIDWAISAIVDGLFATCPAVANPPPHPPLAAGDEAATQLR